MKTLLAATGIVLALASPAFAWYGEPPQEPSSGYGNMEPAPNPPQTLWMQQVAPNTELYQVPGTDQGGTIQQVAPGTTITTPNDGGPSLTCHQNGPMTLCQ